MKIIRTASCILLVALLFITGCSTKPQPDPKPQPDLLAGYHFSSLVALENNKVISDDFLDYLNKLPPEERKSAGPHFFFEDGTGQHAIMIEVGLEGTEWEHVLIYDKSNKRIKVYKYVAGHYRS